MFRLKATGSGFFQRDGAGQPRYGDPFLAGDWHQSGLIGLPEGARSWIPLAAGSTGAVIEAEFLERAEGVATISIAAISYVRYESSGPVPIGTLHLVAPIRVTAWQDDDAGTGDLWHADFGSVLRNEIADAGVALIGGAGNDWLSTAEIPLPLSGGSSINGRAGDDVLTGGRADDNIRGGLGNDTIEDLGGRNLIHAGRGDDTVWLGAYSDDSRVRGGEGRDHLISTAGADRLYGNRGDDRLDGGAAGDLLAGGRGNDTLYGGTGADRLRGGAGDDTMTGGADADVFIFRVGTAGHDHITDFDPSEDRILLRNHDGGALTLTETDTGVLVEWGDDDASLTLDRLLVSQLDGDEFLF